MEDNLLKRIASVANYYPGARWGLAFDSNEGGEWSCSIVSASSMREEGSDDPIDHLIAHVTQQRTSPVFAMRCSSLEVIAVALEHWHAATLAKEL